MKLSLKPQCKKCSKEIGHHEMRALDDGSGFVCIECHETGSNPPFSGAKTLRKPVMEEQSDSPVSEQHFFEQKEYICDACQYKFKRNPEFVVGLCPFCGKDGFVHQKIDQLAQEFVEQ